MTDTVTIINVCKDYTLAAGTTLASPAIDLGALMREASYSLHIEVGTSGCSVAVGYEVSNDGRTWIESTDGYKLFVGTSAFHHRSGQALDGKDLVNLLLDVDAPAFVRFNFFETQNVDTSLTAWIGVQ